MATNLITSNFDIERSKAIKEKMEVVPHYLFFSKVTPFNVDEDVPDDLLDTPVKSEVYTEMIFGKKIANTDTNLLAKKKEWTSNTIYNQYTASQKNQNHYATIKTGSFYRTYLCLSNNRGGVSTTAPSGTDNLPIEIPQDGYVWKYLFSVHEDEYNKFATSRFFPVEENQNVKDSAIPGSISNFTILNTGGGYDNYYESSFREEDLQVSANDTLYAIREDGSDILDFYNGCSIKITSGPAAGEYRVITDYYFVDDQKIIVINAPFSVDPVAGNTYEIMPSIAFQSDKKETQNCIARAIISSAGNTVQKIEIFEYGMNYSSANASVYADPSVNVATQAVIRPEISPVYGHGYDVYADVDAKYLGISVSVSNNEGGNVSDQNSYRTVGIIQEPIFDNVTVALDGSGRIGSFETGERVFQYKKIELKGAVSVNTTSAVVVGTGTKFNEALTTDDYVYITDGVNNLLTKPSAIANSSQFTMNTGNNSWSNTGCTISIVDIKHTAKVASSNSSTITLTDVTKLSNTVSNVIGEESFATASINFASNNNFTINGRGINNFNTFNQLTTYEGTFTGVLQENEYIVQGSNSAVVHSVSDTSNTDVLYTVKETGTFFASNTVVGNTSGNSFSITNKYKGFLKYGSGKILYVSNIEPVDRESNRTETIRIILET